MKNLTKQNKFTSTFLVNNVHKSKKKTGDNDKKPFELSYYQFDRNFAIYLIGKKKVGKKWLNFD